MNSYWSGSSFSNQHNGIGRLLDLLVHSPLKRSRYDSALFRQLFRLMTNFGAYPYFWFHYLFALHIHQDSVWGDQWRSTKVFSADIPHRLQHHGLFMPISERMKREIDEKRAPFYKLLWNCEEAGYPRECALQYLLGHRSIE